MPNYETFIFNPKTMRLSKAYPMVIYDSSRILDRSYKDETGRILIGTKTHPSRQKVNDTLMHELCHSGYHLSHSRSKLDDAQEELRAYNRERERSSPRRWSRILPTRITDFGASVSWLSKKQKAEIKPGAMKILSPKTGGGNTDAIAQAHRELDKDWGPELKPKPGEVKEIRIERGVLPKNKLRLMSVTGNTRTIKTGRISRGVYADTKGQRISRRPHRRWKRIY